MLSTAAAASCRSLTIEASSFGCTALRCGATDHVADHHLQAVRSGPQVDYGSGGKLAVLMAVDGALPFAGRFTGIGPPSPSVELRDFSATTAFRSRFSASAAGGGTVQIEGRAGPLDPTDSAMTPVNESRRLAQPGIIARLIAFESTGASDGRLPKMEEKLRRAAEIRAKRNSGRAAGSVEIDFAAQHGLRQPSGPPRQTVRLSGVAARLAGTDAGDDAMLLNMKLSGPEIPAQELDALPPVLGILLPAIQPAGRRHGQREPRDGRPRRSPGGFGIARPDPHATGGC